MGRNDVDGCRVRCGGLALLLHDSACAAGVVVVVGDVVDDWDVRRW
jgi:hypothetical protein